MNKTVFLLILLVLPLSACLNNDNSNDIYFIDAHSQVDEELLNLDVIITRMEENNIRKTILSARGDLRREDLLAFAANNPTQIIPAIRTKGSKNQDNLNFLETLESDASNIDYKAIAEFLSYHDAKEGNGAPEVRVPLTDEKTQAALAVAQDKGWPFIVHIEFASLEVTEKNTYWNDLTLMLEENPDTPIILIHMGQLDSGEVAELIGEHDNIYFMTSHTDPVTVENSVEPWSALFDNGKLKDEWKQLLNEQPEHFIFAIDNVWAKHWGNRYGKVMGYWKSAMNDLDKDAAEKIAHLNAERLWNIPTP